MRSDPLRLGPAPWPFCNTKEMTLAQVRHMVLSVHQTKMAEALKLLRLADAIAAASAAGGEEMTVGAAEAAGYLRPDGPV